MMLRCPDGRTLPLDRPRIMGILNVTPDSFSDGGQWTDVPAAVAQGLAMVRQGAAIIDVGGESTRPGSERVPAAEQRRRVVPVVQQLRRSLDDAGSDALISIDTTLSEVAEAALDAGASVLNDIAAGREDAAMFTLAAERQVPLVLMHMQGTPATMQKSPQYGDVVAEVHAFLEERATTALAAGIPADQIVLDPGIGFGKTREHNLALLRRLDRLVGLGYPVLLGTSRKRFMGSLCTLPPQDPPPPSDLIGATCATTALGVATGVRIFRVHDVRENYQAAQVAWALGEAGSHQA